MSSTDYHISCCDKLLGLRRLSGGSGIENRPRPCCLLQTDLVSAGTLPAVRMRLSGPMCLSVPPAPVITLWWGLLAENVYVSGLMVYPCRPCRWPSWHSRPFAPWLTRAIAGPSSGLPSASAWPFSRVKTTRFLPFV